MAKFDLDKQLTELQTLNMTDRNKRLVGFLKEAYKIDKSKASEIWQTFIEIDNENKKNAYEKTCAKIFIDLMKGLKIEEAIEFVAMDDSRIENMIKYGYTTSYNGQYIYYNLICYYVKNGQWDEAVKIYEYALYRNQQECVNYKKMYEVPRYRIIGLIIELLDTNAFELSENHGFKRLLTFDRHNLGNYIEKCSKTNSDHIAVAIIWAYQNLYGYLADTDETTIVEKIRTFFVDVVQTQNPFFEVLYQKRQYISDITIERLILEYLEVFKENAIIIGKENGVDTWLLQFFVQHKKLLNYFMNSNSYYKTEIRDYIIENEIYLDYGKVEFSVTSKDIDYIQTKVNGIEKDKKKKVFTPMDIIQSNDILPTLNQIFENDDQEMGENENEIVPWNDNQIYIFATQLCYMLQKVNPNDNLYYCILEFISNLAIGDELNKKYLHIDSLKAKTPIDSFWDFYEREKRKLLNDKNYAIDEKWFNYYFERFSNCLNDRDETIRTLISNNLLDFFFVEGYTCSKIAPEFILYAIRKQDRSLYNRCKELILSMKDFSGMSFDYGDYVYSICYYVVDEFEVVAEDFVKTVKAIYEYEEEKEDDLGIEYSLYGLTEYLNEFIKWSSKIIPESQTNDFKEICNIAKRWDKKANEIEDKERKRNGI